MLKYLILTLVISCTIAANAQQLKVGQKVEVRNSGHWYKSTILNIDGDRYRIHFEGYPSSDDVWILRSYIREIEVAKNKTNANCVFGPPSGSYNNNSTASAGLFKKKIYDWYNMSVNKASISAPKAVGVEFTNFTMEPAYKNIVVVDASGRANRKHNGAPQNTLIYTAKTNYIVCERYSSGDSQTQVWSTFSLYKNSSGEWTCSKDL